MTLSAGCAKKPAQVTGDLAKDQTLKWGLGVSEPETLDPHLQSGVSEFNVATQIFEGLCRLDANNSPIPGVAEKWEMSADGKTYTFTLRKDVKWTNGDPVTAQDFEWSWKRALDPRTGSGYAYQLYYVKGGEAVNILDVKKDEAKIKPGLDAVGVKAKDATTLIVTLEAPTPYFLSLTAFPTLMPLHRATVERLKEKWAAEAANFVTNGPFMMSKWTHNSSIELVKNPKYWDAKNVVLKKIIINLVDDSNTELTMWESGQVDMSNNVPNAEIDRLKKEKKLTTLPWLATYYYSFNVMRKPFDDVRVRKAFTYAIDRKAIVEKITKAGQVPALAFVPPGIPDADPKNDFRKIGGDFFKDKDLDTAKKLLTEAGYKDMSKFPTVEILYNSSPNHKVIAEAIQEMWSTGLGIPKERIKLRVEEWKVYLPTRQDTHNFQVARAGWIGDYVDPMTFLDMWVKEGGNNDTQWASTKYDELIKKSKVTTDAKTRTQMLHDAEKILMDEMPIGPIYYYVNNWLIKPYVKSYIITTIGVVDFKSTWIAKH
jgi:oligopeptide transport system substrate-binding protein